MNIGFWLCGVLVIPFVIIGVLFAIFKERAAKFVSGFNSLTSLTLSKRTVEINASPFSFFCFSIMELKPPMVSASSPLIEPLRSRMNTISVKFFLMFSTSAYKNMTAWCLTLQSYCTLVFTSFGRMASDIIPAMRTAPRQCL